MDTVFNLPIVLLVYDVTDRGSFENIKNWVGQIQQHADFNVNKILIGNKCDMDPTEMAVKEEEGKKLASDYGIQFFQTSAKHNLKVTEAFEAIAKDVMTRLNQESANPPDRTVKNGLEKTGGLSLNDPRSQNKACGCI